MSDNIDYDELDRAVKAASSERSVKIQAQKTAATAAPVKRPVSRGTFMDFAPRRTVTTTRRVVHAVRVSAPRPAQIAPAAPKQIVRPAAKPVAKPIVRPAAKPVARPAAKPIVKPATKPVAKAAPAPVSKLANRPAVKPTTKTVAKPTVAPARPASKAVVANKPSVQKPAEPAKVATPNANNYSLGGRSPFMTNAKVEKRPLGSNIPETSASSLRSTHNVYSQKSPARATENAKKHIITQESEGKSGWIWTLIVIGVIAAGGALGYLLYLAIFAK